MLRDLLYTLYIKQDYKYRVYKRNSRPYFRDTYLKYYLGSKLYKEVYANSVLLFYQLIYI